MNSLTVTVIMPVYNGVSFIKQSLPPLVAMKERGEIQEVIVVDDTSSDETPEVARALGASVMPSGGRLGPGAARNVAAKVALGEILWFIDADVIVHNDAATIMLDAFDSEDVVAVFGSYDDQPPAQNFLSQYKNLVHHFYHQKAKEEASTFWSGCGAIRKQQFLAESGFDVEMFKRPSVEDIELGYRLLAAGGKIRLKVNMRCTHLKEWRFWNLIHTEIFCRAIPWSRLMLGGRGLVNDLNVGVGERLRAAIAGLFALSLLVVVLGLASPWLIILALFVALVANKDITVLFFRRKGFLFAVGAFLFHQLYYLYSAGAFAYVVVERALGVRAI